MLANTFEQNSRRPLHSWKEGFEVWGLGVQGVYNRGLGGLGFRGSSPTLLLGGSLPDRLR